MTKNEFDLLTSRFLGDALELGYPAYMQHFNAAVNLFDKARRPVADAAWFLFSCSPALQNWLIFGHPEKIKLSAKVNGEAAFKMGLAVSLSRDVANYIGFGQASLPMYIIQADQFTLVDTRETQYPDRQATADAAEFLVARVGVGSYWLKNVGAQHIRADAKEFEATLKAREVEVKVTVSRLVEGANSGYIDLKFYKGDVKVGETHIVGKTESPYVRRLTLSGPYDIIRAESTPSAIYSVERVKK